MLAANIRALLVKPGRPIDATLDRLQGDPEKTFRLEAIAEEIEAALDATDKGLARVLPEPQLCQKNTPHPLSSPPEPEREPPPAAELQDCIGIDSELVWGNFHLFLGEGASLTGDQT